MLQAELGVCYDPTSPKLIAAVQQIRDAGLKVRVTCRYSYWCSSLVSWCLCARLASNHPRRIPNGATPSYARVRVPRGAGRKCPQRSTGVHCTRRPAEPSIYRGVAGRWYCCLLSVSVGYSWSVGWFCSCSASLLDRDYAMRLLRVYARPSLQAGKTMWHFDANITNFVCLGEPAAMMMDSFRAAKEAAKATRAGK